MNDLQCVATWAEQLSTSRTDRSIIELFNQQQDLKRDRNVIISKFSECQTQYKNEPSLTWLTDMWR